ncbi:unnamed protein product [Rotaria sp. Silwood1]|nr:unnamed protein product [Rotaria sp. Silwood1]CAF1372773.1 unnamed protein product [Rotaria sp. Silwood1]CAF4888786.1 unnamed protein product [Rotaria sp. Silwood1]CAF4904069.1 unnamed protein product [Rotaria sp. Silwood1]
MKIFNSNSKSNYPKHSSILNQSKEDYLFKNLFHGFRYLDFAEQLIQTRSIHDYKHLTHIFDEMKDIHYETSDNSNIDAVFNYFDKLSTEYKTKLNTLVLANVVKGTFDCSHNTEQIVEKTEKKTCENTKYKIILIDSLITSSSYCDEYLSTVKQIEGKVHEYFKQFNIIHIKIKTLASNEGVPQTNID